MSRRGHARDIDAATHPGQSRLCEAQSAPFMLLSLAAAGATTDAKE
jgi:hypothetical protein